MKVKSRKYSFTAWNTKVRIEGFGLHKVISEMLSKRIEMHNILYVSDTEVVLFIKVDDFQKVKRICGNKYRVTVLNEKGIAPFFRSLRLRKATISGLALFFIIVYYQSLFLDEISIYGFEKYTEEEIREVLEEVSFTEGSRKLTSKDQLNAVKLHLYNELDNISWVGIEYKGTKGEVTIVEGNDNEGEPKETYPCNIIADKSGYIAKILPESGIRMFEDGEYVNVGDVIISGVMPINSTTFDDPETIPKERYVHAEGEVEIYVPHRLTFTIIPGIIDSMSDENEVSATFQNGENEYDFVKRVADREIRKYLEENAPESAKLTKKDLNFEVKESKIEVSVFLETLEKIGIKQEIMNGSKQPV